MSTTDRPGWKAEIGPLAVVLIWGSNFIIMKAVLAVMHPHAMNALRLTVSFAVLGLLHWRIRKQAAVPLTRQRIRQIVGVGLVGYFLYQVAFVVGLNRTTAGSAALIMAGAPIWTALLARLMGFEFLRRLSWIGLVTSIAGTIAIVVAGSQDVELGSDVLFGNAVMLGAAFLWGSYTALNSPLLADIRPVSLTFYAVTVSLPLIVLVGLPYLARTDWAAVTPAAWAGIVVSGALSTGLATALWNTAVRTLGASHTAAYGNAVPVVALLGSALLLGEPVFAGQIVGGVLIIGGLLMLRRSRRPYRPPA
jgi:drug/metabolite transporter (DMT)-like permease